MKAILFATLLLSVVSIYAQNPGVKVAVSPAAIKNFNDNILPIIISKLGPITVPDVHSGKVSVTNIVVNKFSLPSNAIVAQFGDNSLKLGTSNFGVEISAHAQVKILFVKIGVSVTATCHDSSALADISFTYANEHPQISVKNFDVSIHNLNIKFGSSIIAKAASAIVNLFKGPLAKTISSKVSSGLGATLASHINDAIQRVPNTAEIKGSPLAVAYNLISNPNVTPSYFSLPVDGSFYETSVGKVTPPITPAGPMPDYDTTSGSQVQAFLNQYVFNSGLYSAWHAGMLKFEISKSLFDPATPFKFDISWLQQFISQITQFYDLSTSLVLDVLSKNAPTLSLTKDNIGIALTIEIALSAVVGEQKVEIFSADCDLDLHARFDVSDWILKPSVTGGSLRSVNITRSSVGELEGAKIQEGLNQVANISIPRIDFSIASIPLPKSLDVDMSTISLAIQDGYIQINANPVFIPPTARTVQAKTEVEVENKSYWSRLLKYIGFVDSSAELELLEENEFMGSI